MVDEVKAGQGRIWRASHQKCLVWGARRGKEMVRTRDGAGLDDVRYDISVVMGAGVGSGCQGGGGGEGGGLARGVGGLVEEGLGAGGGGRGGNGRRRRRGHGEGGSRSGGAQQQRRRACRGRLGSHTSRW